MTRLNWEDVLAVCGPQVRVRALLLTQAHEQLASNEIPPRLKATNFTIAESGADFCRVSHSPLGMESLALSTRVLGLLWYFDGRPTTEVVEQIIKERKLRITPALLRRLVDFKILTPCE